MASAVDFRDGRFLSVLGGGSNRPVGERYGRRQDRGTAQELDRRAEGVVDRPADRGPGDDRELDDRDDETASRFRVLRRLARDPGLPDDRRGGRRQAPDRQQHGDDPDRGAEQRQEDGDDRHDGGDDRE